MNGRSPSRSTVRQARSIPHFCDKMQGLNYAERDADDYLTMRDRDYEAEKKRLLGLLFDGRHGKCGPSEADTSPYHDDQPSEQRKTVSELVQQRRKQPGCQLRASFYKKFCKSKQFTMTVSPYEMRKNGWTATSGTTEGLVSFEIQDKKGNSKGTVDVPDHLQ